ncbi:MAG: hypothetical protein JNK79_20140 [Chitinophagaceae bacterium]|nr:hypothetical protein [Chitinophagaceae bacterium]
MNNTHPNTHLDLYKYLAVLTEAQIVKLRNIALGIMSPSSFTNAEIQDLERNLSRALDNKKQ